MFDSPINKTLGRTVKIYRPGTLNEMQIDPDVWEQVLHLEKEINAATLAGETERLRRALNNYELLIMVNTVFQGSRLVTGLSQGGTESEVLGTHNAKKKGGEETVKKHEAFPSTYLTKEDLDQSKVWTMDCVHIEELEFEGEKDPKPILYFEERESKPLVLNVTNWNRIEKLYGEDSDSWTGHKLEVYRDDEIMFGKQKVGGVRVRKPSDSLFNDSPVEKHLSAPT